MKQEEALAAYQAMFPDKVEFLSAERIRIIGHRLHNEFRLWDHTMYRVTKKGSDLVLIYSNTSWEHVLVLAAATVKTPEDESPIEDDPKTLAEVAPGWVTP